MMAETTVFKSTTRTGGREQGVPSVMLPYALFRRTSVPSLRWQNLIFDRTLKLIDEYLAIREWLTRNAGDLCLVLERAIGALPAGEVRSALIGLKRDIYNDRLPKTEFPAQALEQPTDVLAATDAAQLRTWFEFRSRQEPLLALAGEMLASELTSSRMLLRKMLRNRAFRRGLATASASLSHELDSYLNRECDEIHRLRQVERSLVRYYSRCAMKLSPFSAFLRTSLLRIGGTESKRAEAHTHHSLSLNRAFTGQLAEQIAWHNEFAAYIPVYANSAMTPANDHLYLLRREYEDAEPGRFRIPRESVAVLPQNELLKWVLEYLRTTAQPVTRRQVVAAIEERLGPSDKVTAYVGQLIQLGVLVPASRCAESLDYVLSLLAPIDSPAAQSVKTCVAEVRSHERELNTADAESSARIIARSEEIAGDTFAALGRKSAGKWEGMLFFEDCIDEPQQGLPFPAEFSHPLNDLETLIGYCATFLDDNFFHRKTLSELLRQQFHGGPAPLLQFVQFCGDFMFKQPAPGADKHSSSLNPLELPELDALLKLRAEVTQVISNTSSTPEVDLLLVANEADWLARFRKLGVTHKCNGMSFVSCYCQPVADANGISLLVNSLHRGPGRPLLRFLANFQDQNRRDNILTELRDWMYEKSERAEICELAATFDFNVNLHPHFTRTSINYSGKYQPGFNSLTLGELMASLDSDGHIRLTCGDLEREIIPADFGMMADLFQPFAYRLLVMLGGAPAFSPFLFNPYWWPRPPSENSGVVHFPRLRFGRCIVRRRAWAIPKEQLPIRQRNESDVFYFSRVRAWQKTLGLPEQVFVREAEAQKWITGVQQKPGRKQWLKHKPEYVHFGNFFLLQVFEKLVADVERLYVEEMLPGPESWQHWGMSRPMEFVVDLHYRPAAGVEWGHL